MGDLETSLLSFGEFTSDIAPGIRIPLYNNFFLYFADLPYNGYREMTHYVEFQKQNHDLDRELTDFVTLSVLSITDRPAALKIVEPKLYRAYLAMRMFVSSNQELFR